MLQSLHVALIARRADAVLFVRLRRRSSRLPIFVVAARRGALAS